MAEKIKAKRLVLLDVHAIVHRAYHALPDFSSSKGEPTGALYGLSSMLLKIVADLKPDYIAAAYDLPGPTFRKEAYDGYKGTRKKLDDALVAQLARSRAVFEAFNIPMYDSPGFEADDILGTIVEHFKGDPAIEIVVASGDMDTLQLVSGKKVKVFTLKKGLNDTVLYDEEGVMKRFGFGPELLPDYKGLRGDPSDNIIGIAGIGEKTATTLIQTFGSIEAMYKKLKKDKKAFEQAGIKERIIKLLEEGQEEAEFSKMLATIRRDAPISFALPEKEWKESVDVDAVTALFSELEFRTFTARLRDLFGKQTGTLEGFAAEAEVSEPAVPAAELKETLVALWLVDSTKTDPTIDDIYQFAGTKEWTKCREAIFGELKKRGVEKVFTEIEAPLIPIVEAMHERGIAVDRAELAALSKKYHAELDEIQKKIWKLAGSEFNVNSPRQLGEVLFETLKLSAKGMKKTEGGAQSTRESELAKLKGVHPIIELVLSFRELSKLLGTYIDTIPNQLDDKDRLHSTFLQAGSATGRMASNNPNLQNIPNKTELGRAIRKAFVAASGFTLLALDYSQIELRVAAFLSGDEKLIDIFRQGADIHTAVASQVFKVGTEEVTKEMRRQAKVINFGIIYGMGINALRENLGTDRATAQEFYNNYFETFKGLAAYLDRVKADAERTGYTETFFGRRRYFEGMRSKVPYIKAASERMAINAPIQGTEADIVKLAMIRVEEYLRAEKLQEKVRLLLQVHDELVFEVKEGLVHTVAPKIKQIMENIIDPKKTFGVVCVAEASAGKNWGEMEHIGS